MRTIQTLRRAMPGDWRWSVSFSGWAGYVNGERYFVWRNKEGLNGAKHGNPERVTTSELTTLITKLKELP